MARGPSKLNSRITLAVMALLLVLFVYEFIVRDSGVGAGLPGIPDTLAMFTSFLAPFALLMFGIQAVVAVYGAIGRMRAGQPRWSRGKRTLGAWVMALLLGLVSYLVYQVSIPINSDDAIPDWLVLLVFPVGIATLLVTLRAIALSIGLGGSDRSDTEPREMSASLKGAGATDERE